MLNRFSTKSILVFGVTPKEMTIGTCNFHWLFILSFSIHDKIFKIFLFVFNYLRTFSVSNIFSFFSKCVN